MAIAPAPTAASASAFPAPASRAGVIPRPRLLRRLTATSEAPIAMIVAPAGYGKTTLLAEWAARDQRPFAWVSLAAVGGTARQAIAAVAGLVEDVAACPTPHVVVLDDADRVASQRSMRHIVDLACRLPAGSMLALASRRRPAVPIGRLRAHRLMVELGPRDLAMTRLEAALLLDAVGLRVDGEQVDELVARTEGWAVGLYLAALSIAEQPDADAAIAAFGGTDRFVAEYVRDELLADLPEARVAFLRRTSILSRLSAPLCDAVLDASGSAAVLHELAAGNVLIQPLDRDDAAFRYHPLLAGALRAELLRIEPELEPALHRRASDWLSAHGEPSEAVGHAVACRDVRRAGRLLWSVAPSYVGSGRASVVHGWLEPFTPAQLSGHAALALTAAATHLAEGHRDRAEQATEAAAHALGADAQPGDLTAAVLMLRACIARDGVVRMGEDAAHARALVSLDSAWQSVGLCLGGIASHLAGNREAAARLLEDGVRRASVGDAAVTALCHAQLTVLALERDDGEQAASHADHARAALGRIQATTPAHALVLAVCAVVAARRGEVARARRDATDALAQLTALAGFVPWYLAEAQIWLALAQIRLSDAATARTLLSRAARSQAQVQDAPVLGAWLHAAWERADAFAAGATGGGPALTNAELRVLRFLPSHLSFREIGARLHVSTNTVKTQALSVYRKLDVSCRSEAVARGQLVGLIDGGAGR
jgi:LuxR family maltose regulon positive regulatory protein